MKKILRLEQISDRTGVKVATLRWLRHNGRGPKTFKLANRVVAFEEDVDAWVAAEAEHEHPRGAA